MKNEIAVLLSKMNDIEIQLRSVNDKPMSADEASKYLGIKKAHLYKLTYKNELRYYKPGGKIMFFKKVDLDAWAFRGEVKSKRELRDAV